MSFVETMISELGPQIKVPPPILAYFEWVASQDGLVRRFPQGGIYALIDPAVENSSLGLSPPDKEHAVAWVGADTKEVRERLAPFCRTGGDGSYAAFWVDDEGVTQIVHLGSGSGSTMIGVMVSDPVDFLRLIAIGYDELCWPEQHALTPEGVHEEEYPADDYEGIEGERPAGPHTPDALRKWLVAEFGVTIPERASEIIGDMPDMMDENSDDPFCVWLEKFGEEW